MRKIVFFGLVAAAIAGQATSAWAGDMTEQYALKQRCGEQVTRYFSEGNKEGMFEDQSGTHSTSYEAHFNPKTLKCFMSMMYVTSPFRDKTKRASTTRELVEVNENKSYGSLFVFEDGQLMDCQVNGQQCHSATEWKSLAAAVTGE